MRHYTLGMGNIESTWELAAIINELLTDMETVVKRYNVACAADDEEKCDMMVDRMNYLAKAMNRVDARLHVRVSINDGQIVKLEPLYDDVPMKGLEIEIKVIE